MSEREDVLDRRGFLAAVGATGALASLPRVRGEGESRPRKRGVKLGFDNFSIRSFGWKAERLIDYAAEQRVDTLLLSDLDVYESLEDGYLRKVGERAREKGIELQVGTGSICPTSSSYDARKWGPAVDHLRLLIRVARAAGSAVARCYLGTRRDRDGEGGIYRHIEETVKVCRAVRAEAVDAGVKIAIENHAGDMQAWELAGLIEEAGKDHVGTTLDSGNATWTLEDPMVNLEILGPYAASSGMRDSAVWESEKGATVMWANMGGGSIDWRSYCDRFEKLCPGVSFVLEILSYVWPRELPYLEESFWDVYPRARAREFARFVAMAKRGKQHAIPAGRPAGERSKALEQAQQKWDLEESLRYCREELGLGLRR